MPLPPYSQVKTIMRSDAPFCLLRAPGTHAVHIVYMQSPTHMKIKTLKTQIRTTNFGLKIFIYFMFLFVYFWAGSHIVSQADLERVTVPCPLSGELIEQAGTTTCGLCLILIEGIFFLIPMWTYLWCWRGGSMVKRTNCSCRGPHFNSQNPHGCLQTSASPVLGDTFSDYPRLLPHTLSGTHVYIK